MKKRIKLIASIVFVLIFILGFSAVLQNSAIIKNSTLSAKAILPWDNTTTYTKGDEVIYQNKIFRAKWWTLGEIPNKNDTYGVWEYVKKLDNQTSSTTEEQTNSEKETIASKNSTFKVVAYYPSWKPNDLAKLDFQTLTHVIYAFAIPNSDGTLKTLENPTLAKSVVQKAHKSNAKALLAVGGWSYNGIPLESTFKKATSSTKKRKKLADNIIKLCNQYQFDGVDIDWEYPHIGDKTSKQLEKFLLYLSKKLHRQEKVLTIAVSAGVTSNGTVLYDAAAYTKKSLKAVDWLHVMAYDGGDGIQHSTYNFALQSSNYWKKTRKVPAKKVVLGVPFYARPSYETYENLLKSNANADKTDTTFYQGTKVYYNGKNTIKKKTSYAKKNLGGIMIWEITQDSSNQKKSLLGAIKEALK